MGERNRSGGGGACRRAAFVVAMGLAGAAGAQIPGFPSLFPDPLKPATAASGDAAAKPATESREQLVGRLRGEIAEIAAARARVSVPPAGIGTQEQADLEDARTALVTSSEVQLRALAELDKAREQRAAAESAAATWTGLDGKAPHSILLVDELRDAAEATAVRLRAVERSSAHLRSELERYAVDGKRAEEALRRAQEALDRAGGAAARDAALFRRDLAQLRVRVVARRAASTQTMLAIQAEEAAAREAEAALIARKIGAAERDATFSEADLAKAKEKVATIAVNLRAEQRALPPRLAGRERERDAAEKALAALRERPDAAPDAVKVAESRLHAAEAWVESVRTERDVLEALGTLADEMARMWEARHAAAQGATADERRAAVERLRAAASRLTRWLGYLDNVAGVQRAGLADAEALVARADTVPAALRHEQDRVAALRRLIGVLDRGHASVQSTLRTLDRWVADIDREQDGRSVGVRLADRWASAKAWALGIWNFELFAVEDATVVDGREVKVARGVTVGKSIGAFLVFVVGYWLAAFFARRVERGMVARGFDARRVRNGRRWVLIAVAGLLALFTLNIARIPLTVFAFLGGALALGVGFGTQTIIRNFISGLILLAERRIQIGDIIEVDGVTGTVTAVDLRSSTVLGFDGVETAVPNATLLENKVTNWTHTDKRIRRAVRVGVRYGSSLREVADLLADCAKQHGVVLKDPPPQVIFEDFGADTQVFALYFWVELKPAVSAMQVASDLRHMIARRFAEAGIVIAYPQRDIHLDAAEPLRIELMPAPGRAA